MEKPSRPISNRYMIGVWVLIFVTMAASVVAGNRRTCQFFPDMKENYTYIGSLAFILCGSANPTFTPEEASKLHLRYFPETILLLY